MVGELREAPECSGRCGERAVCAGNEWRELCSAAGWQVSASWMQLVCVAALAPAAWQSLRRQRMGSRAPCSSCSLLLLLVLLGLRGSRGVPTLRKERAVHPEPELSERQHEDNQSFQYDHEAFLGKEDAKTFDQLTPEESKERLG